MWIPLAVNQELSCLADGRPAFLNLASPWNKSHRQPEYSSAGIHRIIAYSMSNCMV